MKYSIVVYAMAALCGWFMVGAEEAESSRIPFRFREPAATVYHFETSGVADNSEAPAWLRAWPDRLLADPVEFGNRVVLQLAPGEELQPLIEGRPLELSRTVAPNTFILQSPDAWTAAREAARLAEVSGVTVSYPVKRRSVRLDGAYARRPNDSYFSYQWHLENRDAAGASGGPDLNVRAAWPFSRGQGVIVAIADSGVELSHPDLAPRAANTAHSNFHDSEAAALPSGSNEFWAHGTAVAGLVAAEVNNSRGATGVAPDAHFASWVIFAPDSKLVADDQLMDMYQYQADAVAVQNHSWGSAQLTLDGPSFAEQIGIDNALQDGRDGLGVVMVRSAGNNRSQGGNANDDGYVSDPRVIAVAAVRLDGRVASTSEPGACVLVSAPSGDSGFLGIFTTDLMGLRGFNPFGYQLPDPDFSDYTNFRFSGTSASAPQISGVAALLLSANPALTYRDVQQILLLSARHFDLADPDVALNGAGLRHSHNVGFGVPDAGVAVQLALRWQNRPALTSVSFTDTTDRAIVDDGMRLLITGENVPGNLLSIRTLAAPGSHPDEPTPLAPLMDVGVAPGAIEIDLTGKAALIQRGGGPTFEQKIQRAAAAGAVFAVIYNNEHENPNICPGGDQLCSMGNTEFVPIPAVFIGQSFGEALRDRISADPSMRAQIKLDTVDYTFTVSDTLACEHVGVRVKSDHTLRGDLRITLVSPHGTRSVLQRYGGDTSPGPGDWTYYSTRHFYESSAGDWTVSFSDQGPEDTGSVLEVTLTITGVAITDTDKDGLPDDWEIARFDSLDYGPRDDPDGDGYSNAVEQVLGSNPLSAEDPFNLKLDFSTWNSTLGRLSWPGVADREYEVWATGDLATPFTREATLPGKFPVTEWFTPPNESGHQFFQLRAVPPGEPAQ